MVALHRFIASVSSRHPIVFVSALTVVAFLVRLAAAPLGVPLLLDAFAYMRKAVEITHGNFIPMASHAIGWPIVLAPFVALAGETDPMTLMNVSRIAACAAGALVVVPTAVIAWRTLVPSARPWAVIATAFAEMLVRVSTEAFAEPLLTLMLMTAIAAVLAGRDTPRAWMLAGVFAGLACWVHATGIVVPIIAIVVAMVVVDRQPNARTQETLMVSSSRLGTCARVAVVAAIVALPAMLQRVAAFGSPLSFGQNTRFFAEAPADLWNVNATPPGLASYIRTHTAAEIADRLLVRGLGLELGHFAISAVHLPVVPFLLAGSLLAWRDRSLKAVLIAMALFLAAWVPVYDLFGAGRHLAPAVPLAIVIAAAGFDAALRRLPHAGTWTLAAVLAFAAGETVLAQTIKHDARNSPRIDGMIWGRWIATHVRGELAMVEGHELVMMHLPDASVAGADVNAMYAPVSGLRLVRPGGFGSLEQALDWMRAHGVTHVAVDGLDASSPWSVPLRDGGGHASLPVERYATDPGSRWPMRVYELRWDRAAAVRQ